MARTGKRQPEAVRFMSHVLKHESGCWLWQAYVKPEGYGYFRTPDRHEHAHRVSYRLFCGDLTPGLDVMHSCDVRACVNPAHLSQGTRKENIHDARRKGRNARGERHGRSKLTAEQAEAIKTAAGSQTSIAKQYGISQTQVWKIKSFRNWIS